MADDHAVSDDVIEPSDRRACVCHDHIAIRLKVAGYRRRGTSTAYFISVTSDGTTGAFSVHVS
jgi:hypothetical protein